MRTLAHQKHHDSMWFCKLCRMIRLSLWLDKKLYENCYLAQVYETVVGVIFTPPFSS